MEDGPRGPKEPHNNGDISKGHRNQLKEFPMDKAGIILKVVLAYNPKSMSSYRCQQMIGQINKWGE